VLGYDAGGGAFYLRIEVVRMCIENDRTVSHENRAEVCDIEIRPVVLAYHHPEMTCSKVSDLQNQNDFS
jgi:hypothetical protein